MVNKLGFIICLITSSFFSFGQDTTRVSLLFVGDVMQHDSQIRAAFDPVLNRYDYTDCFRYIKPIIQQADVAIANLEVTLAGPPFKGYPQFSAPDELATGLKEAGFDIVVTANNHSVDRRKKGIERTIDVLDSLDILHTGTFKDSISRVEKYPLVFKKNDLSFSLLNYTYGTNGLPVTKPNVVNLIDTLQIKADLIKARQQQTDAVIVFVHWGMEYQDSPNKFQKELTDFCFQYGATLVIGSHPHVLQPMEWRKTENQLVVYSLGNFVSGQQSRFRDGGGMLWVDFEKIATDTMAITRIKNAIYELEWVYRNNESPKKYFVLPVKEFENDTVLVNEVGATAMKIFIDDSRKLLKKNLDIIETDRAVLETSYYKILLKTLPAEFLLTDTSSVINFYGLESETQGDSLNWTTGKFHDKEIVERALEQIKSTTPYTDASIIWYYWGNRKNKLLPSKKNTN